MVHRHLCVNSRRGAVYAVVVSDSACFQRRSFISSVQPTSFCPVFPSADRLRVHRGLLRPKTFGTRFTFWIWIIPLSVLIWHFLAFETGVFENSWQVRFEHFMGSTCRPYLSDASGRPCFDQLVYTAPVCTALAYTIGALVRRRTEHSVP